MYKKILVPIDGSRTSMRGLLEAIRLAKTLGAKLKLVHIVEDFAAFRGMGGAVYDVQAMLELLHKDGEALMTKAMAVVVKHGAKAESAVYDNVAERSADLIVGEATKWRANLIVLGTHGRRGVSRLVMGSDAEIVIRTSPVPVLLVRFPETGAATRRKK